MRVSHHYCNSLIKFLSIQWSFNLSRSYSSSSSSSKIDQTIRLLRKMNNQKNKRLKQIQANFPSFVTLNVLGNGALPNPRCVMLTTEYNKYLFNCGEGSQRVAVTHKTRLTGLKNIFVTHSSWDNISGIPGMCLTLNTAVTAHGPLRHEKLAGATRTFDSTNDIKFTVNNDYESGFKDNFLNIDFIPIFRDKFAGEKETEAKLTKNHLDSAFVFVCRLNERPGKLIVNKCIQLKVPPGPLLGKLKAGQDITLEDGTVIKTSDVTEPTQPGCTFVVLECPSLDYLDSLITNEKLSALFEPSETQPLEHILHFSPLSVISDPRFQNWISKFPSCSHIGFNEHNPSLCFFGANIITHKLRMIDDKIFVSPYSETEPHSDLSKLNLLPALVGTQIKIHPINSSNDKICTKIFDSMVEAIAPEVIEKELEDSLVESKIYEYKEKITKDLPEEPDNGPSVIFLGTGSATPGKYRTASCIVIETDENNLFMMDCGEGSFGQFYRFYGPAYKEKLANLKAIFISHSHADHQLGLVKLLQERQKYNNEPVFVIVPFAIERFLLSFHEISGKISHLCHIGLCQEYANGSKNDKLLEQLNLSELQTVRVQHCRDAWGIVITTRGEKQRKIVYSGDAMPTKGLIEAGKGCDLLIHEATFEDDLFEEAILKRHSTFSQAYEMGKFMNADFTLFTHFSQRYYKAPILPDILADKVGIAFDNMRVKFSDLPRLLKMSDAIQNMFADNAESQLNNLRNRALVNEKYDDSLLTATKKVKKQIEEQAFN